MARFKVLEKKDRSSDDSDVLTPPISKKKKKERANKQKRICNAIMEKRTMSIRYTSSGAGGERIVEPYIHELTKRHNPALRCYQLEGPSASGQSSGWKLFLVDKIPLSSLKALDDHFVGTREGYNKSASESYACAVS